MARHRAKIHPARRLAVYVRDNWTCQYCGRVFVPDASNLTGRYAPYNRLPGDPDIVCLELDHIHPVALGGDNSEENLQAACTPCNKRKLATTRHTKWNIRIRMAQEILADGPETEATALKAAAALLGCQRRELPKPTAKIRQGA